MTAIDHICIAALVLKVVVDADAIHSVQSILQFGIHLNHFLLQLETGVLSPLLVLVVF